MSIAIGILFRAKSLGGLHAVVTIEGIVRKLAQGNHASGLVEGTDDEVGRTVRTLRAEAGAGEAIHAAHVPSAVAPTFQFSKPHALRGKGGRLARIDLVPDGLEIGGHLASQHLDVSGSEHPERGTGVGDGIEGRIQVSLVPRAAGRYIVGWIEGDEIEALSQYEDIGDEIAAPSGDAVGSVVAAGTGVGIRRRESIEPQRFIKWPVRPSCSRRFLLRRPDCLRVSM